MFSYLKQANEELRKVTWPSRKDTVRYSLVVVGVTLVLAIFFAALDFGLTFGLEKLIQVANP
ncbi:preprotein translocase subunit SecE [Candidatus Uhrbacteria bacterium]|nr:preprotein translocase subunit SecE [Candidatus Uhrbacteria bacterium]